MKNPGLFVGLQPDGQAKPVIYTKNGNVFFYPQVIKCTFTLRYFHFRLLCNAFVSDNFITFLLSKCLLLAFVVVVVVLLEAVEKIRKIIYPKVSNVYVRYRVFIILRSFIVLKFVCAFVYVCVRVCILLFNDISIYTEIFSVSLLLIFNVYNIK